MRILYIHQYFCTRAGKTGTRSYEFARRWVQQGHQVTMLTSNAACAHLHASGRGWMRRASVDGIEVLILGGSYSQRMGRARRILSFVQFMFLASWVALRHRGDDVVFATSTPLTVGVPGALAARRQRVPLVFEVRDLWPEAPIQFGFVRHRPAIVALGWLERWIYAQSRHIVALSPGMRDAIVAGGIDPGKVSVVPNCSDLDLFRPASPDGRFLHELGLQGRFVVVHAGAMGLINGLEYVLDAARILQESGDSETVFLLLGDGSRKAFLQARVESDRLRNVVFAPPVPRAEVPRVLASSHVCLMIVAPVPVLETASPNKLFDALAAGRPAVINCGGWMATLLRENEAGYAVDGHSPRALAEVVQRLRNDADLCARLGCNARALAERCFDRQVLAAQVERILQQAASGEAIEPVQPGFCPQPCRGTVQESAGALAEIRGACVEI